MLHLRNLSALSLTLLMAGTASARGVDIDVDKSVSVEKNFDLDIDRSVDIDKDTTIEIDKSTHVDKDTNVDIDKRYLDLDIDRKSADKSFNHTTKINDSIFASPVASGYLSASVSHNAFKARSAGGLGKTSNQSNGLTMSGNANAGFRGIGAMNLNGGLNGGLNAIQQTNVSVSVVASTSY